jgi:hypothetical protein
MMHINAAPAKASAAGRVRRQVAASVGSGLQRGNNILNRCCLAAGKHLVTMPDLDAAN